MIRARRFAATLAVAAGLLVAAAPAAAASAAPVTAAPLTRGALASDGQTGRYLLGGQWLLRLDPGKQGLADGYWRDRPSTAGWAPVTMPNSFNAGDLSQASFTGGTAWYRRDFTLPSDAFPAYVSAAARRWVIEFESVSYTATVWLNGHRLGAHTGAYLPFQFTMTHLHAGVNRLVIRVSSRVPIGGFPRGDRHSGWWNFGGILDAVYLRPVAGSEIEALRIRTPMRCSSCTATVQERATIRNFTNRRERVALSGRYGSSRLHFGSATIAPRGTWRPSASILIRHPRLWAPGSPQLYHATLRLVDAHGRRLGGYSYQSGIRTITVRHGILRVNGRQVHLRGVNMQEQTASTGAALSLYAMRAEIGWVRELGATIIRAHYPLNPEIEQMADSDGIMLWSEVPIYHPAKVSQASVSWRRQAVALVKRNIETNQDHPSILLWSLGNEFSVPPATGQAAYIAAAAAAAHRLDPTRPVGMALLAVPWGGCLREYAPLQVIGVNPYYGWFQAGGALDNREGLGPFMRRAHRCYANKALFASEFGYGSNRSGPTEVKGTYQNQIYNTEYALGVFDGERWLAGAIDQTLQDFASAPGFDGSSPGGTPPIVDKGLVDWYGVRKPSFSAVASLFRATTQIAAPR